jgi:hypothetical protein
MNRYASALALTLILTPAFKSQTTELKTKDDKDLKRIVLLSELRDLEVRATRLNSPLSCALARAEIANAVWQLDEDWAKRLLREAYQQTFPEEQGSAKPQDRHRPVGVLPMPIGGTRLAIQRVRSRVLAVASHDREFVATLANSKIKNMDRYEEHLVYADLAKRAFDLGDKVAASQFIVRSIEADPSQINAGMAILDIAERDRALADQLTIQYIDRLRSFQLSSANQSQLRVFYILANLVFAGAQPDRRISPPSPTVMRSYVAYMLESLAQLEQREPGTLPRNRGFLLMVWEPLEKFAPDLRGTFAELEALSRTPDEDLSLTTMESRLKKYKEDNERRAKHALEAGAPDENVIRSAIERDDFVTARKLIDKLEDSPLKTQLNEQVNMKEALNLLKKGDILVAKGLASKLNRTTSILHVYPTIMEKCVATKDQPCIVDAFYQGIKQLKRADSSPEALPGGIPASIKPSEQQFDPTVLSLGRLAKAIATMDDTLAFQALDEMVDQANHSKVDSSQGYLPFDLDVFDLLSTKDPGRAVQAAYKLENPLWQIVGLATIDHLRVSEIIRQNQLRKRAKSEAVGGEHKR